MAEKEVRAPDVDSDKLLQVHADLTRGETDASSLAGERRQKQGQIADEMVIEPKALSQFRAGLKIKNEGKRRDWLRSIKALIPIADQVIEGNQPDMLGEPTADVQTPEPVEPMSDADVDDMNASFADAADNIEHVDFPEAG